MPEDSGSGGEKTEDPTPKKMRDARNEGQVAFSTEANTALILLVGFSVLLVLGPPLATGIADAVKFTVTDGLHMDITDATLWRVVLGNVVSPGIWAFAIMGVAFIAALIVSLMQVGLHVTPKPLQPKWNKLSPLSGLKRIFGLRGLMRTALGVLKLVVIGGVAWAVLQYDIIHGLVFDGDIAERVADKVWVLFFLAMKLAGVLAIIAIIDVIYQRWQHHKDMKMTKQEVKEEYKQSEGDPHVKAKIRQIQRQMAQNRMMQEVPKADVVITNPTHVAVALRYDPDEMEAPICVAKGYDDIAQKIKEIARENDIVMVENVKLARGLAKRVEIGDPIPLDFFQAVAEVLATVYRLNGKGPDGRPKKKAA